jgi:hypothetical protein
MAIDNDRDTNKGRMTFVTRDRAGEYSETPIVRVRPVAQEPEKIRSETPIVPVRPIKKK